MLVLFYIEVLEKVGFYFKTSKKQPYSGFIPVGNAEPIDYFITIIYNNSKKILDIKNIKNDKAYKLISILLDTYPIKPNIKIPIDIYLYKNNIYPDLESLDFSKVEGYEDAIDFLNKNN